MTFMFVSNAFRNEKQQTFCITMREMRPIFDQIRWLFFSLTKVTWSFLTSARQQIFREVAQILSGLTIIYKHDSLDVGNSGRFSNQHYWVRNFNPRHWLYLGVSKWDQADMRKPIMNRTFKYIPHCKFKHRQNVQYIFKLHIPIVS